ncbi:MAG: alpha-galactosidase [Caldilineaceae bacterium]|nr:alpha-galactosidase [Caldilineaceae bacterium]
MTQRDPIILSNSQVEYVLSNDRGLKIAAYRRANAPSWLAAVASPVFALDCDQERIDGQSLGFQTERVERQALAQGAQQVTVYGEYTPKQLQIEIHTIVYPDSTLTEHWFTVRNAGQQPVRISRLDSISIHLSGGISGSDDELLYFTSGWGAEFEGVRKPLQGTVMLETRHGRSSQGQHPWFALTRGNGEILSAAPVWSGNWVFRFEPLDHGAYRLSGGLHDWEFFKDLAPGSAMDSVPVVVALGADGDLNSVSTQYARIGRKFWYPTNSLTQSLPVEWNHWWSYEDKAIDEDVFRRNADVAAELGIEICTLDAGWFGPTESGAHWYEYRGDWDQVNSVRFPSGIRFLSDYVHDKGMKFGLWCEIEGLGKHARLAEQHPDFVAMRSDERLGYVCFGNPAVQAWALETLERLIDEYGCDWIKLDFNLDPGAGCNHTDHGHGAGDGLYEHYRGYYRVLAELRARHPQVILESCSSGGLRIDLGLMRHTHMTFLSDPDWPEHDLQLFWGATTMLAPNVCLHWSFSEWIHEHQRQTFNPRDPNLQPHQLDYYTEISQLGVFGFSQKLPELPGWVAERFAHHIRQYQTRIEQFVREGDLYRLTEQPKRAQRGERWAGFQYSLPDGTEHLLFVFRLDGGEAERTLRLRALQPEQQYALTWLTEQRVETRRGHDLMVEGLHFHRLTEEEAAIVHFAVVNP